MSRSGQPSQSLFFSRLHDIRLEPYMRYLFGQRPVCRTLIREAHPIVRYAGDPAAETPLREPA